jgi:REP element-mobilizing transposase RayT
MGQSLSQIFIHLVFGTKNRKPLLANSVREELHAYIAGILKELKSPALKINSVEDHIHILFLLSKNYALFKVVEEVKKSSSKWIKTKGISNFAWQIGYGAFSVSSSKLDAVKKYIDNQEEHHKKRSFVKEVELFMKEYGANDYDKKFFWR